MDKRKRTKTADAERFLLVFKSFNEPRCLEWPYTRDDRGYGRILWGGMKVRASRAMCMLAHGAPPFEGAEAAHECGNSGCVNPRHLRWSTHKENMEDMVRHGRANGGRRRSKIPRALPTKYGKPRINGDWKPSF